MQGMTWIVLFIVFGGFSLLSTKIKPTQRKLLIRITYIVLLLFSIIYSPSPLADIYRYKEELLYMKSYGAAASALHLRYIYDYSTGFLVFMRIMSLMPTWMFIPVTMTLTYGILLYMYSDSLNIEDVSYNEFGLSYAFLLCCTNYGIVTSNMRFCLAMSIGFLGIYLWYKNNNRRFVKKIPYIVLIVIPVFLHLSAFIIPVMWVFSLLYHIKWIRIFSLLLPFVLSFSDRITTLLSPILGSNDAYNFAVDKFERYSGLGYSLFERTRIVYYVILLLIIGILLFAKIRKLEDENEAINNIYVVLALIVVGFIPIRALFYRTIQYLIALTPVYWIRNRIVDRFSPILRFAIYMICMFVLVYYSRFSTYYYM